MKHTECEDCKLKEGDCGHHFKMDGKTNYDIASLSACDQYGNCMFFKPKAKPQGDLISREALKAYARKVICGDNPTNSLLIRMFDEIIDNASAEVKLERDKSYEESNYTSVSTGYATYTAEDIRTCCYCKHHNASETLQSPCRECINYDRWEHK